MTSVRRFGCGASATRAAFLAAAGIGLVSSTAVAGPVLPTFSPSDFQPGAPIDNPYLPLKPGTVFHYAAQVTDPESGDTAADRDEDFVTFETKQIAGVTARVVRARTWLDDVLVEDTLDYYAQDKVGNVWYLGEDTRAFEYDDNGQLINTDTTGSFRAGVNGAKPGFVMPANPQVGFSYFQEFAQADAALDQAQIVSRTESLTVPAGQFTGDVLKTLETTELEPGVREFKLYAPGVGLLETLEDVQPDGTPLNTIPLVSVSTVAAVPLPAAVWSALPLLAGLTVLPVLLNARRRRLDDRR